MKALVQRSRSGGALIHGLTISLKLQLAKVPKSNAHWMFPPYFIYIYIFPPSWMSTASLTMFFPFPLGRFFVMHGLMDVIKVTVISCWSCQRLPPVCVVCWSGHPIYLPCGLLCNIVSLSETLFPS